MRNRWLLFTLLLLLIVGGEIYWFSDWKMNSHVVFNNKQLSPENMQKDISYFFSQLKFIHPDLYRKFDSIEFIEIEKKLKEECVCYKTYAEFEYILLTSQYLLDGHTGILAKELFKHSPTKRFPQLCFKSKQILLGEDTLLQVGGVGSAKIKYVLNSMVSWEYNTKRSNMWKNDLFNLLLYEKFNIYFPVTCTLARNGGIRVDTTIVGEEQIFPMIDYFGRRVFDKYYQKPYDSVYYYKDGIAVLYYNTSDFRHSVNGQSLFADFINDFFEKVKFYNIHTLFIDVTQNGGGSDYLNNYIISRLNHKETYFVANLSGKRKAIEKHFEYLKKSKEGREWIENIGLPLRKQGLISMPYHSPSVINEFDGRVFVLGGYKTYSAAFSFCSLVKRLKCGILVGEELGQRFPFCGNIIIDSLPHSRIPFQVPVTFYWESPSLPLKEGYLQPDIPYPLDHPLQLEDFKKIMKLNKII